MSTNDFEELRPLFGLTIDAPAVVDLLAIYPEIRVTKPSDGAQYLVCKSLGFDLLFKSLPGVEGTRNKRLRPLICIFLYREGRDKHKGFAFPPFGIAFSDTREMLLEKLGTPFASSDADALGQPWWDKWHIEELSVHIRYDGPNRTSTILIVTPVSRDRD